MFVEINGARLFFDVLNPKLEIPAYGSEAAGLKEKPVMVCIPGGPGGDHQTMRPFFDRFASVAQVVYLDPRGGGRSDLVRPAGWALDQWGDDIPAFCDALGVEKPVVLGTSGGSLMVQAYLARHPAHARGAILINACSRMEQDEIVATYERFGGPDAARAARAMYGSPGPEDYAAFMRQCLPLYSARRDLLSLAAGRGRTRMNPAASQHFFAPNGEAWRFDHRAGLSQVESPVLVAIGDLDPVTPAVWGREVAAALPHAELLAFDSASHFLDADEPERLTASVTAFIRRIA
jgi:pimeloyl-ACP methyl ester carboxylesterase